MQLDQFYTSSIIVDKIINKYIPKDKFFVDPCIGTGSFLPIYKDKDCLLIDIDPKINLEGVLKANFLELDMNQFNLPNPKDTIVITNPPFGHACNLAIKFFNKCATFANEIRFIVPKSFRKKSIQNRLNSHFHLKRDIDLPKNSFVFEDNEYNVPCCFQTWVFKKKRRTKEIKLSSEYFSFTEKESADVAIRRVGGKAGQVLEGLDHSKSSTYFIKIKNKYRNKLNKLAIIEDRDNTAGVRSISKAELIKAMEEIINE